MNRRVLLPTILLALASVALGVQTSMAEEARATNELLETIVVTATRTEQDVLAVPASVTVQDMEQLRRNGFQAGTDEYRGVTGVFFRRGEGDADAFPFVSFRGSTGTEGSISLVDGIPFIGLFEELQLNQIPYEAVERIEIVKGPVSALYGRGALYGATNYITRNPDENAVVARLSAGSDEFYRADASLERTFGERGGLLFAGSYENYEGWREQADRRIFNLFGKVGLELSERTTLNAYLNYNDRDVDLPNGRPLGANGEILPFAGGDEGFIGFGAPNGEIENILTAVFLEHRPSERLVLTVRGSYRHIETENLLNFFDPFGQNLDAGIVGYNGFDGPTEQEVYFGEGTIEWQNDRHRVVAGVSAELSDSEAQNFWTGQNGFTFECGFTFYLVEVDYQSGAVLNQDHPCFVNDDLISDNEIENRFWGAFVQNEIALTERWRLTLGLRYDSFERDAEFFAIDGITDGGKQDADADELSPKASLSYFTDWGQVYVAYGRGFNSNFGASFEWDPAQYARPEARPTVIESIELGFKGRFFDERLSTEVIVFYSEQEDRRQIVNNPAAENDFTQPFSLVTFGDVYESHGVELSAIARVTDSTTLRINYTYLDPEWDEFTIDTFSGPQDFSGNAPVGVPEHLLYLQADQQVNERLTLRAIVEHYGDYHYTVNNAFEDGGYTVVSFAAQLTPSFLDGAVVDVTMNNAFDEQAYSYFGNRTSPTYAVPFPQRQFRVAITKRF